MLYINNNFFFQDVIEELLAEIEGESSIVAIKQLNSVLRLFTELISHKNGKFISSNSKIVQVKILFMILDF